MEGVISEDELKASKKRLEKMMQSSNILELNDGNLTGADVCALSTLIVGQKYQNVKSLVLRGNHLTDKSFATLIAALNYDTSIEIIDVGENDLTQKAVYHLLMCLQSFNTTIKELSLEYNNQICSTGIRYMAEILENNTSLVRLNLNGIDLERRVTVLAGGLKANDSLRILELQSTSLFAAGTETLVNVLCEEDSYSEIEELDLSYNPIESGEFEIYEPFFTHENFQFLKVLKLNYNQLMFNNGRFSEIVGLGMEHNKSLTQLHLRGNLFNKSDCPNFSKVIPPASDIKEGTFKLDLIDLSENSIDVEGAKSLLFDIQRNEQIKYFLLEDNTFQLEEGGKQVQEDISRELAENRGEEYIPEEEMSRKSDSRQKVKRDSPAEYKPTSKRREVGSFGDNSNNNDVTLIVREEKLKPMGRGLFDDEDEEPQAKEVKPVNNESGKMIRKLSTETNFASEEPFLEIPDELKSVLKSLGSTFPTSMMQRKSKKKKKGKRNFKKKIEEIGKFREQQEKVDKKHVAALSQSMLHQKMISQGLAKSARLVSTTDQLTGDIKGYTVLLPGDLIDELCSPATLLPGVAMLEMAVRGMKMINTVLWAVLQSFVGFQSSDRHACRDIVQSFFENVKAEKDESTILGRVVLQNLFSQVVDAILLMKSLYSFTEAMFLVVTSERSSQPSLAFYEARDEKLEQRAQKHIHKRYRKVENAIKKENLKKALLRAKQKFGSQYTLRSEGTTKSEKSNGRGQGALTKAIRGMQKLQKAEMKKKAASQSGTLQRKRQERKDQRVKEVPKAVTKFRENCPERIDDLLDDVQNECAVLHNLMTIEQFTETALLFVDVPKLRAHAKERIENLGRKYPAWFEDLNKESKSEELENILPEILKDIKSSHDSFLKQAIPQKTLPKSTPKDNPVRERSKSSFSLKFKRTKSRSKTNAAAPKTDAMNGKNKFKGLLAKFGGCNAAPATVKEVTNSTPAQNSFKNVKMTKADEELLSALLIGAMSSSKTLKKIQEKRQKLSENRNVQAKKNFGDRLREISDKICADTPSRMTMRLKEKFEANI